MKTLNETIINVLLGEHKTKKPHKHPHDDDEDESLEIEELEYALSDDAVDEMLPKKIFKVVNGKKVKKFKCQPGYKLGPTGKLCIKQNPEELRQRMLSAKKAAKKRKGKAHVIAIKRAKTMKKRSSLGI
jgi:hypothetical protein